MIESQTYFQLNKSNYLYQFFLVDGWRNDFPIFQDVSKSPFLRNVFASQVSFKYLR